MLVAGVTWAAPGIESIHFIVPGGAGGGWDSTARATGRVLREAGLVDVASFENISGAGGGKAIGTLVETAERHQNTLMVNSTPIIVRSLTNLFPYSFRDLTPVARTIGEYQAFAVRTESDIATFADVVRRYREDPRSVKVAGGSGRGDTDHLVPALALKAAGADPKRLAYVPYDAGGKALAGFLTGEGDMLSTGFSEVIAYHVAGRLRIIAVAAPARLEGYEDIATLRDQGVDFEFVNWRGFFAAPGLPADRADAFARLLHEMQATSEWEEVRRQNGWQNLYLGRRDFAAFLARQEHEIRALMLELGFLRPESP